MQCHCLFTCMSPSLDTKRFSIRETSIFFFISGIWHSGHSRLCVSGGGGEEEEAVGYIAPTGCVLQRPPEVSLCSGIELL